MNTKKPINSAEENINKAQQKSQGTTPSEWAAAQPKGRKRAKPGSQGEGEYYRIVVRDKIEFTTFRYHDVGDKGHILRLAGKRSSGSWDTQTWLISKDDAHLSGETLVADTEDARQLLASLDSQPLHVTGDIFKAKDRLNVPERAKPTEAQQRARSENIKKAQQARWTKNQK